MKSISEEPKPEQHSILPREMLDDLICAQTSLTKLKGQGKEYDPLIDLLVGLNLEEGVPAIKELEKRLSIKTHKLTRCIKALYEDFLTSTRIDANFLQFSDVECHFSVEGYKRSTGFVCRLPVIPRVGEEFYTPFLSTYIGSYSYHVSNIEYALLNSTVVVRIKLKQGKYNRYVEYEKDEEEYRLDKNRSERYIKGLN